MTEVRQIVYPVQPVTPIRRKEHLPGSQDDRNPAHKKRQENSTHDVDDDSIPPLIDEYV